MLFRFAVQLLGAAALLPLTSSQGAPSTSSMLNVATYNLRLNLKSDGANAWPKRKAMVQALIRYHEFDIFGTQEGLPEQIRDLEEMTEYARAGVGRDDGKAAGEHAAIFFRKARFAERARGDFWLSETPDKPSKGWDARCCNRLVSWVRLQDRTSGRSLLVLSAHFDHEGIVARRESATLLLRWIAEHRGDDTVICLGDFNSTPDTEQIKAMRGVLQDAREVTLEPPYGPRETFNDFKFGAAPEPLIDYIFVDANVRVHKYATLTDSNGVRYPSDHFPVVARIEVLAGRAAGARP
ncbi:MAG: endonuclease/exonuclease/phosphatase family protein [Burkholderiales bacterium]|nr:endonuclease/exonuclease/phosphatase family protein [Burkholderiales bacterium]